MNARVSHLMDEVLKLSMEERRELTTILVDCLDADSDELDSAWIEEIRRRRQEWLSGDIQLVPWAEVRARLSAI